MGETQKFMGRNQLIDRLSAQMGSKDALGNRMVIPQGVRPAQQLPDIYASGGSVQMPKEYSKGNWKLI